VGLQLKLKMDEVFFFLEQMRAHTRYPRVFLFYVSAFLSSARAVTFILQKQMSDNKPLYRSLQEEMLSDEQCSYLVDARNETQKRGYLPMRVDMTVRNEDSGQATTIAGCGMFGRDEEAGLDFVEQLIRHEWDVVGPGRTADIIEYVWWLPDFPGDNRELISVCTEHANRLSNFLREFQLRSHLLAR
jgi:hypothetical protein